MRVLVARLRGPGITGGPLPWVEALRAVSACLPLRRLRHQTLPGGEELRQALQVRDRGGDDPLQAPLGDSDRWGSRRSGWSRKPARDHGLGQAGRATEESGPRHTHQ